MLLPVLGNFAVLFVTIGLFVVTVTIERRR
jgi:hypothetical protein